jgi:hypothetical protein
MSTKAKQQGSGNSSAALFQQASRNLSKRDFKQALKDARVCYRQSPIESHRSLLEQASLGRARELDQAGLKPQAQDILQELLAQPVLEADVRKELPELLSRLGMLERYPAYRQSLDDNPELKARMVTRAADMAVLKLHEAAQAPPEIRHGAALIIAALDKLDAGQDADSLELLKDISRQSPFADWRLFVRGLSAYHRGDQENADANWNRLDPERIPARLRQLLETIRKTDLEVVPTDPILANTLGSLESALWGAPLLSDLRHLKARAGAGEWLKATAMLRNMRERLRAVDPVTLENITAFLRNQAIRTTDRELLKELTFSTDAPAWDLNWNQARAQMVELDRDGRTNEQVKYWLKYLSDLDQVTCWTLDEIRLAKAIIYERLGKTFTSLMGSPKAGDPLVPFAQIDSADAAIYMERDWDSLMDCPPREFFEAQAQLAFDQSLALRPDLLRSHEAFCTFCEIAMRQEQASRARLDLLARFPDHLESLDRLVSFYDGQDQRTTALQYMEQMLRAKPLDENNRMRMWDLQLCLMRDRVLVRDWEQAQAHLNAAQPFNTLVHQTYRWLVCSAFLQYYQDNHDKYQSTMEEAIQAAGHPAPVWQFAISEGAQEGQPAKRLKEYEKLWYEALELPFDPAAAGLMAELVLALPKGDARYTGQVKHVKAFIDYLKLGKKAVFELRGLRDICQVLMKEDGAKGLLDHYLLHGRGKFRQSGFFAMCLAMLNFKLGPEKCDRDYVKLLLTDAQTKIIAGNDADEKLILPQIQQTLSFLEEVEEDEEWDYDYDDDEEEELYDEEEFCILMRREFDRQLSKRVRPGLNVANATKKDMFRITKPDALQEITKSMMKATGLSEADVKYLMEKFAFGSE